MAIRKLAIVFLGTLAGSLAASGIENPVESNVESAGTIVRLDPAVNALIPIDAVVEKVADGFGFIEGPVWMPDP